MTDTIEMLYHNWVGNPNPLLWPEYLREDMVKGQGIYSFYRGLCLGLQLGADAFRPESEL